MRADPSLANAGADRSAPSLASDIAYRLMRLCQLVWRWRCTSFDQRKDLILVERRGRRQRPFERRCTRPPRVVASLFFAHERPRHSEKENEHAEGRNIRADRRDEVPPSESVGIIDDAARHARKSEKV